MTDEQRKHLPDDHLTSGERLKRIEKKLDIMTEVNAAHSQQLALLLDKLDDYGTVRKKAEEAYRSVHNLAEGVKELCRQRDIFIKVFLTVIAAGIGGIFFSLLQ